VGTPKEVVDRLNREMGARVIGGTPDSFGAFVTAEIARWRKAITASGATAE
jgi:hypothetical protein